MVKDRALRTWEMLEFIRPHAILTQTHTSNSIPRRPLLPFPFTPCTTRRMIRISLKPCSLTMRAPGRGGDIYGAGGENVEFWLVRGQSIRGRGKGEEFKDGLGILDAKRHVAMVVVVGGMGAMVDDGAYYASASARGVCRCRPRLSHSFADDTHYMCGKYYGAYRL